MPFRVPAVYQHGITAGAIGATAIAIWFLIVDTIAGRPFFTPLLLGDALISVFDRRGTLPIESAVGLIAFYTLFHYVAFAIAGLFIAVVLFVAETTPSILGGFFILFVVFEVASLGLVALLAQASELGSLAWYQLMAGNVAAALVMARYFWHIHPELRHTMEHALDGAEE
ncbi:MAG: hypothetical protein ACREOK_09245 [Gemmatimonadaceae bacterium]